ncbi:hypothetical protein [Brevifollis gellanilyticus]|uniref:Uncharacterized protein n=1 Tax=Brevifollis gellanilyticus TaxID=748831 RepID=A0A512MAV9_9BACT|nr:hypothetical protein [Brevifollis gellanilyticus]GEP43863.1 hypothetical protein BGE01nite_31540 [Brevifollis gellanilyticus]
MSKARYPRNTQEFIILPWAYALFSFYLLHVSDLDVRHEAVLVMSFIITPFILFLNTLGTGMALVTSRKHYKNLGSSFLINVVTFLFSIGQFLLWLRQKPDPFE